MAEDGHRLGGAAAAAAATDARVEGGEGEADGETVEERGEEEEGGRSGGGGSAGGRGGRGGESIVREFLSGRRGDAMLRMANQSIFADMLQVVAR